ncbi:predicted protein [Naegleria gruberi]|uniref:Predicted protein n=1 Tax=Naegleria gruberi TaxID=5762 RepID=D2VVV6_NAEGR|nr:uncharacterized protein NAEGRDRAFT_73155 [Naegleria gruberi]EFC39170.1 predicted protein [Naegleria gruberi]|eukprot:XP_002671914.1 predicted protein [Naegleria gruberi strain NEG-M]
MFKLRDGPNRDALKEHLHKSQLSDELPGGDIYTSYELLCDIVQNDMMEDEETFTEISWSDDDDITNLFKVINLGGAGQLVYRFLDDYKETRDNFLFPNTKYEHVVPYWYFHAVWACMNTEGATLSHVFYIKLIDFLSHYNEKYWNDKAMCPKWTTREKKLLSKYADLRIVRTTKNEPMLQNLFQLLYERIDVEPDENLIDILRIYAHSCPFPTFAFLNQEFDAISDLERNEEHNQRLRKALKVVEKLKFSAFIAHYFRIIGDATELLDLREIAMKCALFSDETFGNFYIKEILENAPYSIRKILLLGLPYHLDQIMLDQSCLEVIYNGTIEFKVETPEDVEPFLNFLCATMELTNKMIKDDELTSIISNIVKYPLESEYFKFIETILIILGMTERMVLAVKSLIPGFITWKTVLPETMAGRLVLCLRIHQLLSEKQLLDDNIRKVISDLLLFYFRSNNELTGPARVLVSYQMYDAIEPISNAVSNMEFIYSLAIKNSWIPLNNNCLINLVCDYIVKGIKPPNLEKLVEILMRAMLEKRSIYIFAGLIALLDIDKAVNFTLAKTKTLKVLNFDIENKRNLALIQTGIIELAIRLLEINCNSVEIEAREFVQGNTMLRSQFFHLVKYLRVDYADYINGLPREQEMISTDDYESYSGDSD